MIVSTATEQMLTGLEAAPLMLFIMFYALGMSEFTEIFMISQKTYSSWARLITWNEEPWCNILFCL